MAKGRFATAFLEGGVSRQQARIASCAELRIMYCRVFITMPSAKLKCKPGGNMISIIYHAREQELQLQLGSRDPGPSRQFTPRAARRKKRQTTTTT